MMKICVCDRLYSVNVRQFPWGVVCFNDPLWALTVLQKNNLQLPWKWTCDRNADRLARISAAMQRIFGPELSLALTLTICRVKRNSGKCAPNKLELPSYLGTDSKFETGITFQDLRIWDCSRLSSRCCSKFWPKMAFRSALSHWKARKQICTHMFYFWLGKDLYFIL